MDAIEIGTPAYDGLDQLRLTYAMKQQKKKGSYFKQEILYNILIQVCRELTDPVKAKQIKGKIQL
jgi:hypothetical protein